MKTIIKPTNKREAVAKLPPAKLTDEQQAALYYGRKRRKVRATTIGSGR